MNSWVRINGVRVLLVSLLLVFQVSSVASATGSTLLQVFSASLQDHHHAEESADHHASGEFTGEHEDDHEESVQSHEHKHRHSPGEPEHSHSHNHLAGHNLATCLIGGVAFQLDPYLDADLAFLSFDDKATQSPYLSSVFRPPII